MNERLTGLHDATTSDCDAAGSRRSPRGAATNFAASVAMALGLASAGPAAGPAAAQPPAAEPLRVTRITPSGEDVPAGRQLVIQFDRPVVPLGRMDLRADELPIEIEPALACSWRWLDTTTLACELGDGERMRLATRYRLRIRPGITALDGSTLAAPVEHVAATQRPRLSFVGFSTWRGPGTPVMRAVFTQPVTERSVREHLFVSASAAGLERVPIDVEPDPDFRAPPVIVPLPGGPGAAAVVDNRPQPVDDRPTDVDGNDADARRVWLVVPREPLPEDVAARLVVEPGLVPAEGTLTSDETRTAVEFHTFPPLRFVGIECSTNAGNALLIEPGGGETGAACNPLGGVGLAFSAPILSSEIAAHVELDPDLAAGRADHDPWASQRDYSLLGQPHERGRRYTVWLPERLAAATTHRVRISSEAGPRDELGRRLAEPIELTFVTDHRPPDYTLPYSTAVLEAGIDSDVPLYVTNIDDVELRYRTRDSGGLETDKRHVVELSDVEDIHYGVPLGVRALLGGEPGALYGRLETSPEVPHSEWTSRLFAAVTPYQVHVKLGHYNTLVWVTDLATGEPIRGADVSIYVDRISSLAGGNEVLSSARTDGAGIAELDGSETLDPDLALLFGCSVQVDDCPRLFVRVDGRDGLALLPLDYRFEVNSYRASGYTVYPNGRPRHGHMHAWGVTAQGVYRAGDTIDYKLYVRDQSNAAYVAPPAGPYVLEILDPTGQRVHIERDVTLSEFGAVEGEYATPENATVGWYQFRLTYERPAAPAIEDAEAPPYLNHIVLNPLRVLVSDFTPAAFGVTAALSGDRFEAGDAVMADVRAALFSGGPYGRCRCARHADAECAAVHPDPSGLGAVSFRRAAAAAADHGRANAADARRGRHAA